jgi:DNA-binding NtrC family response regulator
VGSWINAEERRLAEAVAGLGFGNPFLPERIELERQALGPAFTPGGVVWSRDPSGLGDNPNVEEVNRRAERLAEQLRARMLSGDRPPAGDRSLYQDVILYVLYYRYEQPFYLEIVADPPGARGARQMGFYRTFVHDLERFFEPLGGAVVAAHDPAHLFALFFQVRRAFHHTFHDIVGGSMAMARLRAQVWQSIFTHDTRRYRRSLYDRLHEISTLVTGPSGTGKDLVAEAIGRSGYIPFDAVSGAFAEDFRKTHLALNLSALSPTLIESELFGHRKGSFTGAVADRSGYLEGRGPMHSVFLDEIGELEPAIQVKLLRVLQTRQFQRIGDTRPCHFGGKIIAATNRDVGALVGSGRFRLDFYYRLCADVIETPTLAEQVRERPEDLHDLVRLLAGRLVAEDDVDRVAADVERWIARRLGQDYPWPGNVRELEQCVRNVLVRGAYRPLQLSDGPGSAVERLQAELESGTLTADELMSRYCTLVYARVGEYSETARRLGLDRRTVKRRIDHGLLEELRGS